MSTTLRQLRQVARTTENAEDAEQRRETAFELWAFTHRKNAAKVAAALNLPERTVRDWVTRHGWEAERTRRLQAMVPNLAGGVVEDVVYALVNSARYARLASELPTDDDGNEYTHVIVDQAGKTHHLTGPTKDRTDVARLSLQLADALAGDRGLAGLLGGLAGDRTASPLAAVGAGDDTPSADQFDAMTPEQVKEWADNRFKRWS